MESFTSLKKRLLKNADVRKAYDNLRQDFLDVSLDQITDLISRSNKTLFILCGLPYSGKTFLAKRILASAPCVFVSIDNILEKGGYDWNTNKLPDAGGWKKVFEDSYRETTEALEDGKNVLYDSTNHTKESRDALREVARRAGVSSAVIFVDASASTVRRRWEENKATRQRFALAEDLLESTIAALEVPTEDERVIAIQNGG